MNDNDIGGFSILRSQIMRVAAYGAATFLFSTAVAMGASAFGATNESQCVPKDAYTDSIEHPAVTHVVHHDAVTHSVHTDAVPATPDLWWNWSPNKDQGPFDGPPGFPDARGTWDGPHENGGPDQGTYGTFNSSNNDNGRASWFHREHGTAAVPASDVVVVDHEAYNETVVDEEAWTEKVDHPAVKCDTDTPTPDEPTVTPTPTFEPGPVDTVKPVTPTVVHAGLEGLPNTGGPNWWLFGAGAVILALGFLLTWVGKRLSK